jgi:hypothetical protein
MGDPGNVRGGEAPGTLGMGAFRSLRRYDPDQVHRVSTARRAFRRRWYLSPFRGSPRNYRKCGVEPGEGQGAAGEGRLMRGFPAVEGA